MAEDSKENAFRVITGKTKMPKVNPSSRQARYFDRDRTGAFQVISNITDNELIAELGKVVKDQDEKIQALVEMVQALAERPQREVVKELQPIKSDARDPRVDTLEKEILALRSVKVKPEVRQEVDLSPIEGKIEQLSKIVKIGFERIDQFNKQFDERLVDVENTIIKFGVVAETISESRAGNANDDNDPERKGTD